MNPKKVSDSAIVMNELVFLNDTNLLGNLMGGRLMNWLDIAGSMVALKHANSAIATIGVDHLKFERPIKLGEIVNIRAAVTRTFRSSMEIILRVKAINPLTGNWSFSNEAFFTFVGLDANGKPIPIPPIIPESQEEQSLYDSALERRDIRIRLAKNNSKY